jgi:hypothetical protein
MKLEEEWYESKSWLHRRSALSVQLNSPYGVSVDQTGRVFIADTDNHVIRMASTDGKISTVADTGSHGYNRD